jgi:hypothetical protein
MWNGKSFTLVLPIMLAVCPVCPLLSQNSAEENKAKIMIRLSANRASPNTELDLEITLRNLSRGSLYVCGEIDLGDASSFCSHTLQVRRKGLGMFEEPIAKSVADGLRPRWVEMSLWQFKEQANTFLLRPDHSLSVITRRTWARSIAKSPGLYEVRVVYNSKITLPVSLEKPFLQESLTSNLVEIEILP